MVGDYNGDGLVDLIHVVDGTDYVNTWISNGSGFGVGSFSPWAGYAINEGPFLTAKLTGGARADLVHVVQKTDYVNVWTPGTIPSPCRQ
jgi:hypothetical protein